MDNRTFIIGIIVCFLLSCSVGIERQYRRRLIGLRTTILVAIGAYMFVSMSFIVSGKDVDVTRIAAGVVSGISFLGAGVIVKEGIKVQGLTTAATLWCDAAIGVLCATGALVEASIGTLIILFVNLVLRPFNSYFNKKSYINHSRETYDVKIKLEEDNVKTINKRIKKFIRDNEKYSIELENISLDKNQNGINMEVILSLKAIHNELIDDFINEMTKYEEVVKVEYKKIGDFIDLEEEF